LIEADFRWRERGVEPSVLRIIDSVDSKNSKHLVMVVLNGHDDQCSTVPRLQRTRTHSCVTTSSHGLKYFKITITHIRGAEGVEEGGVWGGGVPLPTVDVRQEALISDNWKMAKPQ